MYPGRRTFSLRFKSASLAITTPYGTRDLADPINVRFYLLSSFLRGSGFEKAQLLCRFQTRLLQSSLLAVWGARVWVAYRIIKLSPDG